MANAHRSRHGNVPGCIYCQYRPAEGKRLGLYRNKNGNRHNPTSKRAGRRNKTANAR